jgi:excisionase family DNA binding protein
MTVAEVAEYLGVTPHTIYRWIASGRLPAARFSRKVVRVKRSDVDTLGESPQTSVAEPRVAYQAGFSTLTSEQEEAIQNFKRVLKRYRALSARPRSPNDPVPGSKEALLKVVGIMSHEDAEELLKAINEAKTSSPPIEL